MTPLEAFRAILAAGGKFAVNQSKEGNLIIGIQGKLTEEVHELVEGSPAALAAVALEHLSEMSPILGETTPVRVVFVRAKDGLVARWKTERGQVRISQVRDPDGKNKRGKDHG
jgi:hypothetical protein